VRLRPLLPWLVAALTFAALSPALSNDYVNWDDVANFLTNPHFGTRPDQVRWMLTGFHLGHYQPLSWLTLALDKAVWGDNPFGMHLTNLLLHCANAALVFRLALRFLPDPLSAACAALFFSLHPLRVESVAWATERRDVLSGFFALWTVLLYLDAPQGAGRPRALAKAWGVFCLALLSKVTTVALAPVLLVLDGRRPRWKEKLPFFAAAVAAGLVGLKAQAQDAALTQLSDYGLGARVLQSLFAPGFYALRTVLPFRLSPLYVRSWLTPERLALGIAATACLSASIWAYRKRTVVVSAAACALLLLAPSLGLVQSGQQVVACRFTYLASVAPALLFGSLRRGPVPALILAGLGALSFRETRVWSDTLGLWTRALEVDPDSAPAKQGVAIAYANRAVQLAQSGELEAAAELLDKALILAPESSELHRNAAVVAYHLGRTDALKAHEKAYLELRERGK
jgi:protein O-mannosyl-transferase